MPSSSSSSSRSSSLSFLIVSSLCLLILQAPVAWSISASNCNAGQFSGFQIPVTSGTPRCTLFDRTVATPSLLSDISNLNPCCGDCAAGTKGASTISGIVQGPCVACGPGSYSSTTSATTCTTCGVGKYSADVYNSACKNCPDAHYANFTGATSCRACLAFAVSDSTFTGCQCSINYYGDYSGNCRPCKVGAVCEQKGLNITTIQSKVGFYKFESEFYECNLGLCKGSNVCEVGHTGILCAACTSGYAPAEQLVSFTCSKCSDLKYLSILYIFLGTLFVILAVFYWCVIAFSPSPKYFLVPPLTIMFSYFQVNGLISYKVNTQQDWYTDVMLLGSRFLSMVRPTVLEIHCIFEGMSVRSIYVQGFVMFGAPLFCAFCGASLAKWYLSNNPVQYKLENKLYPTPNFITILSTAISCVWFIFWADIIWQVLTTFECKQVGSVTYLVPDANQYCTTYTYLFLAYVVSFPLVFFLPVLHGIFAWTKGARLAAITLSMGFNNSKYFWWYLVTIGRIGLTALAVSVIALERQKLAGVLFVLIIAICLQASTNPYDVDEHNNLALMSFIISFIQLYTRYYYFDSKENSLMNTLMGILCGLLWGGMLIYMFYALYIGSTLYDEKLHAAEAKKGELNQKEESSIGDKQSEDEFRDDDETTDNNSIKLTALTTNANASRGEADDMTGNSGRGGRGNGGGSAVPDYIPMAQDVAPKPVKHTIIFHV